MADTTKITTPQKLTIGKTGSQFLSTVITTTAGSVRVVGEKDRETIDLDVISCTGAPITVVEDGVLVKIGHAPAKPENAKSVGKFLKGFTSKGEQTSDMIVRVPQGCAITLRTVSAELNVSGVDADVTVQSVSGGVMLDKITGGIDASITRGQVALAECKGSFTLNQVSGATTIVSSTLHTMSLRVVKGSLTADLVDGNSKISTNMVAGTMELNVPADTGYNVALTRVSGTLTIDGKPVPVEGLAKPISAADGVPGISISGAAVRGKIALNRKAS